MKIGKLQGDEGIHLAIDLSQGSALSWVAGELAVALSDIGQRVSIPRIHALSNTLEPRLRPRLSSLMTDQPCKTFHIKLNHYWPQFLMQEVSGEVNAELFVTNYRFRGDIHPLDMWSRNLVTNGVRKIAMSSFCSDSLSDLGVSANQRAVMPPGYSPEIDSLFPSGKPRGGTKVRKILIVTNSHDLNRYGTDILIPALAKAYSPRDPVEIHIKDYGSSSGSTELRTLVMSQPSFPKVVWHETFLSKDNLIRLYGEMDLLVSPFRGEGYAMKIIDAMAVGLPVMMPAFGGPMEYAPTEGFLPLVFDEVPLGKCYDTDHYLVGPGAYWCQVREESLVDSLRSYLANPTQAEDAASVARVHVFGRYTWTNAAQSLVHALRQWHAEKETKTRRRMRPATMPLSVILPTKDRPHELAKTLQGFARQSTNEFELVIVNDHGDGDAVRHIVDSVGQTLRARVLDNDGPPGPGAARNLGLDAADGNIFFVTGDDIIPAPDLIARHRDAHRRYPAAEDAFVGTVDWHPEMDLEWFTRHIVGDGAQQFDYRGLGDEQHVPFDRFYTSNVSWKRALTADMEQIFSESFRHAAYEDVELGYRLSKRGLTLRFLAHAAGFHLHPMSVRSFWERMRRVGNMRTVLTAMHPCLVGNDGLLFYQNLELERRRRADCPAPMNGDSWRRLLEPLFLAFEALDHRAGSAARGMGAPAGHSSDCAHSIESLRRTLFDSICRTCTQIGQAEEWSRESSDQEWPTEWVALLRLATHDASLNVPASQQPALPPKNDRSLPHYFPLPHRLSGSIRKWLRELKHRRRRHRSWAA
jgi:glycosyltransferase involved in cell wall biosynthesis